MSAPLSQRTGVLLDKLGFLSASVGCVLEPADCVWVARRRFLLLKARREPERNFLGLDIRAKLVDRSNLWSDEVGVQSNVHFHFANATIALASLLAKYPGQVDCVSIQVRALLDVSQSPADPPRGSPQGGPRRRRQIASLPRPVARHLALTSSPSLVQYPDPHFKKRHHKRRIVQAELVETLAALLPTGATVFLQSDVLEVAEAMRDQVSIPPPAPSPSLYPPRLPPALH